MKLMVIGFPKSGTTTITRAFEASGLKAAHWKDQEGRYFGALIYNAVHRGLDPFALVQGHDAITQADVCLPGQRVNYWPNLDFAILRAIRRAHPECLFVLNYRRPEAIVQSICKWPGMQQRFTYAEIPGLPRGYGAKPRHLVTWIENHFDACRTYFANDERFLEIDIESAEAPELLGSKLGCRSVIGPIPSRPMPTPKAWSRHA